MDGLTTNEAARILGVPNGTVKAQLARARAKLRRLMCREAGPPALQSYMTSRRQYSSSRKERRVVNCSAATHAAYEEKFMWIVKVALNRPYTFIVLALLILILSPVVILRTPTDIFPSINIPVVAVAWQYTGMNPEELEGRLTSVYERILTALVDNIQHIESTTVNGQAIVKIYLQPGASLDTANAQVTAASQTILRQLPPGTLPPLDH